MHIIELQRQPVELHKILKFEGLASSGGEAKALIADGQVLVNDAVETRKRRKMLAGDVITVAGERYLLTKGDGAS